MSNPLQSLRRHPVLATGFLLALFATVFFAVRTLVFVVYWTQPQNRDLDIEGWMTAGYVAHSWQVPRDVLRNAIGPLPDTNRPSLEEIAAGQDVDLETLVARIETAIALHREAPDE